MMDDYRARQVAVLTEAQQALNVAFGAILSAYVGNSLAEIDNRPFDHVLLARFFVLVALFILGLCVGNSVILRGDVRLGIVFLAGGAVAAVLAHRVGRAIGFEVTILRILTLCWVTALIGSNVVLTLVTFLHHRNRP